MGTILGRAAMDPNYLALLKKDPKAAAQKVSVDLTPDEFNTLKSANYSSLENFNSALNKGRTVAMFDKKDA